MADEQIDEKDRNNKSEDRAPAPPTASPKPVRQVVVKHLEEPPPSGKQSIHPRRPAPIVPTREERTGERPAEEEDKDSKKPSSE